MPAELKEMMRHESIEATLRYYVSSNAERTADTCWQRSPGADDAYAKAFASEIHNGSHNTTPARVAVNPEKTNTPGWTRTSGLAFRRRDPFGPRSATGSPTQVRPAGLEPATLGLEIRPYVSVRFRNRSGIGEKRTSPRAIRPGKHAADTVV